MGIAAAQAQSLVPARGSSKHTLNQSRTCCTVRSPSRIQRSHRLHFMLLKWNTLGGAGSDAANSGSAKLAYMLRNASMGLPCTTLYSSRHTRPAAQEGQHYGQIGVCHASPHRVPL